MHCLSTLACYHLLTPAQITLWKPHQAWVHTKRVPFLYSLEWEVPFSSWWATNTESWNARSAFADGKDPMSNKKTPTAWPKLEHWKIKQDQILCMCKAERPKTPVQIAVGRPAVCLKYTPSAENCPCLPKRVNFRDSKRNASLKQQSHCSMFLKANIQILMAQDKSALRGKHF